MYGTFPPAYVTDDNGRPAHSWRVLLLPFLDQAPLYAQYRFDEPWDGPNNSKLADKIPEAYRCPSFAKYHGRFGLETPQTRQLTNYVAAIADDGIFEGTGTTALTDITDGASQTLTVVEARNHAVHWMQPDDPSEMELLIDLQSAVHEHHANHLGGMHCLFADGSVRYISSRLDPKTWHGLVTRSGGESLAPGDF